MQFAELSWSWIGFPLTSRDATSVESAEPS
jgi:hypothetical protein